MYVLTILQLAIRLGVNCNKSFCVLVAHWPVDDCNKSIDVRLEQKN